MPGLDEASEQIHDLSAEERAVYTSTYDLVVADLVRQWQDGRLVVPRLLQREYVWSREQAGRLIESLLLGIPIPHLYFVEQPTGTWEIIDGQKRVLSVVRFVSDGVPLVGLSVLAHLNGLRFEDLGIRERRKILDSFMPVVVIAVDSHPAMVREIFARLNTGATALTAQELRVALYAGPLTELLVVLTDHPAFRAALGSPTLRKRLVDQELVLRFLALRTLLLAYRPPLARFLDEFAQMNADAPEATLSDFRGSFDHAVGAIESVLGPRAFRLLDRSGRPTERSPNRAVFDAQMLAMSWWTGPDSELAHVEEAIIELSARSDYRDAVTTSTADRARTLARVAHTLDALASNGLSFDLPQDVAGMVRP